MSLFERAHKRSISVAFPNQQAQRFLFWTAGDTHKREQKGGRETQASFHFFPLHRIGANAAHQAPHDRDRRDQA
jgi:hypothetical protein